MNRIWTQNEIEIIRAERAKGTQVPVIARLLNRPVPATYLRARLIGTLVQPHRSATDAERTIIRVMATAVPASSDEEIAAAIGRNIGSTRYIMKQMGLVGVRDVCAMASARYVKRPLNAEKAARTANKLAALCAKNTLALEKARNRAGQAAARDELRAKLRLAREVVRTETLAIKQARITAKEQAITHREKARFEAAERKREADAIRNNARAKAEQLLKERSRLQMAGRARENVRRKATEATARAVADAAARASIHAVNAPIHAAQPAGKTSGRGGWIRTTFRPFQPRLAALAPKGRAPLPKGEQDAIVRFLAERGATRIVEDEVTVAANGLRRRGYIVLRRDEGYLIDGLREIANDAHLIEFARVRLDRAA